MDHRLGNDNGFTNDAATATARSAYSYGTAAGIDQSLPVYQPGSAALGLSNQLNYFYSEYFKGLVFLALSLFIILAVPTFLTRAGGLKLMINRVYKRATDIVAGVVGLILTAPFWLILPIIIKLDSRGPVFYTQLRVGVNRRKQNRRLCQKTNVSDTRSRERRREDYHGSLFRLFKFRTMVADAERDSGPVWATKNDPRITRLGRFMRMTRLDEIPQFINIIKGDMSLVGPRPERPAFVEELSEKVDDYTRRLQVKPGLTGLAQVTGGYDSSISSVAEKVKRDLEYIDNWSLWSDVKIMMKTIVVVLTGKGAC